MNVIKGWDEVSFTRLVGETIVEVNEKRDGAFVQALTFVCENGDVYEMFHDQECSEEVTLEDVIGSWNDIIGHRILSAGKTANKDNQNGDSRQWTFYTLRTNRGTVTLRWYGESNGWYSEDVGFYKKRYSHLI